MALAGVELGEHAVEDVVVLQAQLGANGEYFLARDVLAVVLREVEADAGHVDEVFLRDDAVFFRRLEVLAVDDDQAVGPLARGPLEVAEDEVAPPFSAAVEVEAVRGVDNLRPSRRAEFAQCRARHERRDRRVDVHDIVAALLHEAGDLRQRREVAGAQGASAPRRVVDVVEAAFERLHVRRAARQRVDAPAPATEVVRVRQEERADRLRHGRCNQQPGFFVHLVHVASTRPFFCDEARENIRARPRR